MQIPNFFNRMGIDNSVKKMPEDGLVFWANLISTQDTYAYTGQALTFSGNEVDDYIDGIACISFDGTGGIYTTDVTSMPSGNNEFTASIWARAVADGANKAALSFGRNRGGEMSIIGKGGNDREWKFGGWDPDIFAGTFTANEWHHILQTFGDNEFNCYVDGVFVNTTTYTSLNITYGGIYIGNINNGYDRWNGALAGARIYNRVLTDEEIALLASEFTPSV